MKRLPKTASFIFLAAVGNAFGQTPAEPAKNIAEDRVSAEKPEANPTKTDASAKVEVSDSCKTCDRNGMSGGFDWSKHPRPDVFPRQGAFPITGSGPGYYSAQDWITGTSREKPPAFPYPPFILQPSGNFNNDYRYLDKPDNTQTDFFDLLKRMHPTENTMLTVGGQHSIRFMDEVHARLGKPNDNYSLFRNRIYADFWYQDIFRVYGEFINAGSAGNDLAYRPIDRNGADFLNLFAEIKTLEVDGTPIYVRAGRQELLYGSQRLVSTLDWANTRRTFDGVKAYWHSDKVDVDVFFARPVVISSTELDKNNPDINFYGAWFQYRPKAGVSLDLYYLGYENKLAQQAPYDKGNGRPKGRQDLHTFGSRLAGNEGQFLYDVEGMVQTGTFDGKDHLAYAWTTGAGWEFKNIPWRPQAWVYNDYASGTSNPKGDSSTFQQLFPFGHYYFGYIDLVGRQNINDINVHLNAYPDNWITLQTQFHHFTLAQSRDFLYNAAGKDTRRSATGSAGTNVGNEVDFLINFHINQHNDFMVGYSKFFAGDFIRKTKPDVDSELFYMMYNFRW